jgi:hypothetical protein
VSGDRTSESETVLAGGQRISFRAELRTGGPARVSVAYREKPARESIALGLLAGVLSGGSGRWTFAYGLAAAALAVAVLMAFYVYTTLDDPSEIIAVPTPAPAPSSGDAQREDPPAPADVSQSPPQRSPERAALPPQRPGPAVPGRPVVEDLADVRRVYIDASDPELRAALASRLGATNLYEVVDDERSADAAVTVSTLRGAKVAVSVVNRAHKTLWDGPHLDVTGEGGAARAAEVLVESLVDQVEREKSREPEPR